MNPLLNLLGFCLGIYILLESLAPICAMQGGLVNFCHKAKYVMAMLAGLMLAWYGWFLELRGLHFLLGLAVALFVWPRTVHRVHALLDGLTPWSDES